jgi:hypothetical protein
MLALNTQNAQSTQVSTHSLTSRETMIGLGKETDSNNDIAHLINEYYADAIRQACEKEKSSMNARTEIIIHNLSVLAIFQLNVPVSLNKTIAPMHSAAFPEIFPR